MAVTRVVSGYGDAAEGRKSCIIQRREVRPRWHGCSRSREYRCCISVQGITVLCSLPLPSRLPLALLCGSRNRTEPLTSANFLRHFEDSDYFSRVVGGCFNWKLLLGVPRRILMAQRQIVVYRANVNFVDVIPHRGTFEAFAQIVKKHNIDES